jgi:alkylation response protein AidB-like acyl-CoA dehydrogenase
MEMTIGRGRWQEHLKSGGDHYHALARELEALPAETGAGIAALACHALAELLERCRAARLTRNQHVLLQLGALIARTEGAAAFARRAQRAADRQLNPKAVKTLRAPALAAASRVYARDTALTVATDAVRLAGEPPSGLDAIHRAQAGLLEDMQAVAEALYARKRP